MATFGAPGARAILGLLPGQFLSSGGRPAAGLYARVLGITDFVSGMTDSYAVAVAAKLGPSLRAWGSVCG